jgi:hypothetical protein
MLVVSKKSEVDILLYTVTRQLKAIRQQGKKIPTQVGTKNLFLVKLALLGAAALAG